MSNAPYLVSRVLPDGSSTPLAVAPSRKDANEMIAKLEAADPKGTLVFYSRVPMEAAPSAGFRVAKAASVLASFAESF